MKKRIDVNDLVLWADAKGFGESMFEVADKLHVAALGATSVGHDEEAQNLLFEGLAILEVIRFFDWWWLGIAPKLVDR